jgi:hypothetical protein
MYRAIHRTIMQTLDVIYRLLLYLNYIETSDLGDGAMPWQKFHTAEENGITSTVDDLM